MQIPLPNHQATENLGYLLGRHLPACSTILLKGDLGAGKTTLVQGIGRGLDITESIVSPTFTLVSEYLEGRIPLYHLDLYRLSTEQVTTIYPEIYWEGIEVDPGITAIEWSERLSCYPRDRIEISLIYDEKKGRQATLTLFGSNDLNLSFLNDLTLKS
ncbi:tRNA (adenosine(37)-N6)-threonylcarbamoyltransferase complex ATPase subunit type 1 TsaE [Xenococcus sp. PCC 7305]|uniref:tRNA (adenosine(37)-N6)-threonylcarbamoyltransferase complex ATPase subunit type 1 TsaE n=1 Tax=Xenococcus sp. PCC 7305 TaxID=102125 RepID=UPI000594E58C